MEENYNNNDLNSNNQMNKSSNGLAVAGFVVGVISIFINFYTITGIIGLILSIVGLKKSKQTETGKGLAIAGICCSIVGIIVGIIAIIAMITAVSFMVDNSNEIIKTINELNSIYNY
ncbi:MAG: DUF4190 domain-containing protein [Clostridia bacterium]|nr:DUF4190 domain-containing protein [Clostridia bacterium]